MPLPERPDDPDDDDDDSGLRRRTFLERHDWMPWIGIAALVGGLLGFLRGSA